MNVRTFVGVNSIYMKENGEKMSHEEVFTKIVETIGLENCIAYIPATKEEIQKALEKDSYLNNIPLKKWEDNHPLFINLFLSIGINTISLSDTVSTLKRSAKMWAKL